MPSGPRKPRRRSGCAQCKAKHVQCTEELPICRLCERHGWPCERGLRVVFQDDAAQRGVGFGRHGTLTSQPQLWQADSEFRSVPLNAYVGRWIFVNTVSSNFTEVADNIDGVSTREEISDVLSESEELDDKLPMDACLGHPLAVYPDLESYLLEYFIHGIGPDCSLTTINNPYISLITPLSFCHTTLRNAVISVAANQLRLLGDTRFSRQALVYKNKALKGLQQAISLGSIDDGIIATVLMLCFHAISHESDPSWVTHLQGGLDLIYRVPGTSPTSDSLRSFFEMYFVAHAIMSRTASPERRRGKAKYSWSENVNLDEIDTIMGCSRRLMGLINDISDLPLDSGHAGVVTSEEDTDTDDRPIDTYISRASRIACALSTITQTLPDHSKDRDDLSQIAETKRLAALIYLIGRVNDADMIIDEGTNKFSLVSMLINIISTLPDTATLLWPLYILGHSGLEDEDHRRFVLDRLERIQRIRNLGSVRRARVAVKHAFQVFDMRLSTARAKNADAFSSISLA